MGVFGELELVGRGGRVASTVVVCVSEHTPHMAGHTLRRYSANIESTRFDVSTSSQSWCVHPEATHTSRSSLPSQADAGSVVWDFVELKVTGAGGRVVSAVVAGADVHTPHIAGHTLRRYCANCLSPLLELAANSQSCRVHSEATHTAMSLPSQPGAGSVEWDLVELEMAGARGRVVSAVVAGAGVHTPHIAGHVLRRYRANIESPSLELASNSQSCRVHCGVVHAT